MDMTIPIDLKTFILVVGLVAGGYMFSMLLWSYVYPHRRVWPPKEATAAIKLRVWFMTITIFAAAFVLGLLDWNYFDWSPIVRWSIGLPLVLVGNLVVWRGVLKIGMAATSGEASGLRTDDLYSWSRNPQYVADIFILVGWGTLAASLWTLPVLAIGLAVLLIAPFAEEPWLEASYGEDYRVYRSSVRRYV